MTGEGREATIEDGRASILCHFSPSRSTWPLSGPHPPHYGSKGFPNRPQALPTSVDIAHGFGGSATAKDSIILIHTATPVGYKSEFCL